MLFGKMTLSCVVLSASEWSDIYINENWELLRITPRSLRSAWKPRTKIGVRQFRRNKKLHQSNSAKTPSPQPCCQPKFVSLPGGGLNFFFHIFLKVVYNIKTMKKCSYLVFIFSEKKKSAKIFFTSKGS